VGLIILALVGVPLMAAMIVAVGVTKAALSPEVHLDVAKEVANRAPALADDLFESALQPGAVVDANARAWLTAAHETGVKPSELLVESGLINWLRTQPEEIISKLTAYLNGKLPEQEVVLRTDLLKGAFLHPRMQMFFSDLLSKLPPCEKPQLEVWGEAFNAPKARGPVLPACDPGVGSATIQVLASRFQEYPDQVRLLRSDEEHLRRGMGMLGLASGLMWLLLLGPLVVIFAVAALGGGFWRGFWTWSGVSVLLSALLAMAGGLLLRSVVAAAAVFDPAHWHVMERSPFWSNQANVTLTRHAAGLFGFVLERFTAPVSHVAAWVAGAGILFIVFALLARSRSAKADH